MQFLNVFFGGHIRFVQRIPDRSSHVNIILHILQVHGNSLGKTLCSFGVIIIPFYKLRRFMDKRLPVRNAGNDS